MRWNRFYWFKNNWHIPILAICTCLTVWARLAAFGDPRLSLGTDDSSSFVTAAQEPLFTWGSLTAQRLPTTSIVYRLCVPPGSCRLIAVSRPATDVSIPARRRQPGFDRVAILQALVSLAGWTGLALAVSRHIRRKLLKLASAILILAFGFSPQLAEWDSLLTSESLSFSLFALSLAMQIEFSFALVQNMSGKRRVCLVAGWFLALCAWVFVRDTNLYVLLALVLLALPLAGRASVRGKWQFWVGLCLTAGLFILGSTASRESLRWKIPLTHVFAERILPYPERTAYFQKLGMPQPDQPAFKIWFDQQFPDNYLRFLASHPGIAVGGLYQNLQTFFAENRQPYFHAPRQGLYGMWLDCGEFLHARTGAVFWLDLALMTLLLLVAWKQRIPGLYAWAWLGGWLFLAACLNLFVSYHADTYGIVRHTLGAVLIFRLYPWLFLPALADAWGMSAPALASTASGS